jgi:hypothetical protein
VSPLTLDWIALVVMDVRGCWATGDREWSFETFAEVLPLPVFLALALYCVRVEEL